MTPAPKFVLLFIVTWHINSASATPQLPRENLKHQTSSHEATIETFNNICAQVRVYNTFKAVVNLNSLFLNSHTAKWRR
jgi:hypothetical protein